MFAEPHGWKLVVRTSFLASTGLIAVISTVMAQKSSCTLEERRDALRAVQAQTFQVAPRHLDTLETGIQPGGPLAGWMLSHGDVVFAHSGAAVVGNPRANDPWPQLLEYAPSKSSSPSDWVDFEGPDGPYRLIGWGYTIRYVPGSRPPTLLRCIAENEWWIHDAGWHLRNGNMLATPDAATEPLRPKLDVGFVVWHPQYWVLHFWAGEDGTPTVSFANPKAPGGGLHL